LGAHKEARLVGARGQVWQQALLAQGVEVLDEVVQTSIKGRKRIAHDRRRAAQEPSQEFADGAAHARPGEQKHMPYCVERAVATLEGAQLAQDGPEQEIEL